MDIVILFAQVMIWASLYLIDKRQAGYRAAASFSWFGAFLLLSFGAVVAGLLMAIVATSLLVGAKAKFKTWQATQKESDRKKPEGS